MYKITDPESAVLLALAKEDSVAQAFEASCLQPFAWRELLQSLKFKKMVGGSLTTQQVWLTEAGQQAAGAAANPEWRTRLSQVVPARLEVLRREYDQENNPYQRVTKQAAYIDALEKAYGVETKLAMATLRKAASEEEAGVGPQYPKPKKGIKGWMEQASNHREGEQGPYPEYLWEPEWSEGGEGTWHRNVEYEGTGYSIQITPWGRGSFRLKMYEGEAPGATTTEGMLAARSLSAAKTEAEDRAERWVSESLRRAAVATLRKDDEQPATEEANNYYVFVRSWTVNSGPGREKVIERNLTYAEARRTAQAYNAEHKPGKNQRKAEFTTMKMVGDDLHKRFAPDAEQRIQAAVKAGNVNNLKDPAEKAEAVQRYQRLRAKPVNTKDTAKPSADTQRYLTQRNRARRERF